MPGTRLTAMGANIDITPTFIDIAGLPPHPEHDGKSLMPLLLSSKIDAAAAPPPAADVARVDEKVQREAEAGWRTSLIIEYLSVGTYYVRVHVPSTPQPYSSHGHSADCLRLRYSARYVHW
jgi:arylsulfatase A-like enzyme